MAGHCLDKSAEAQLRAIAGNNVCCDCDGKLPQWASVSFGIFMCLECSGRHRALGVHISFVRSVSMDSWTEKQIKLMRMGGNDALNAFLQSYGVKRDTPIAQKYNSPAAMLYRDRLLAAVEGRPLPTELPRVEAAGVSQAALQGTDPLPGESEADYVARQRRLQAEAKERLRQKFGSSSGLSSNGSMQGIGSDSSYRPGEASSENLSDKALSVLQSSWSILGDTVSKGINEDSQQQYKAAASKGWAAAVDLWNRATEVTTDLVQNINKPDEEVFKFPRPAAGYSSSSPAVGGGGGGGGGGSGSSYSSSSSSSSNGYGGGETAQRQPTPQTYYSGKQNSSSGSLSSVSSAHSSKEDLTAVAALKKPSSWDDEDDSGIAVAVQSKPRRASSRTPTSTSTAAVPISPSKADLPPPAPQTTLRGASPAMSVSSTSATAGSAAGASASGSRPSSVTPTLSTAGARSPSPAIGGGSAKGRTADAPSGDDFFATFGV